MKTPRTQLLDGEGLIREGGGGPASFLGAKGGHLYLTNKRIFHESLIGQKLTFEISLNEIVQCDKVRWSNLACLIPLMKCLKLYRKDGSSVRLNVADKDGWCVAINDLFDGSIPRSPNSSFTQKVMKPQVTECSGCGAKLSPKTGSCDYCSDLI